MRTIPVSQITDAVKEMCIEANLFLTKDMEEALKQAQKSEEAPLGHSVLDQLCQNLQIAGEDSIPICQDTGMAVVFLEVGQEVHFEGGILEDAVNEGIRRGDIPRAACANRWFPIPSSVKTRRTTRRVSFIIPSFPETG